MEFMTTETKIGDRIRFYRKLNDFKQEYVADKIGLSVNAYGDIERGLTDPSVSRLEQIAQALNVPVSAFFADSQPVFIQSQQTASNCDIYYNSAALPQSEKEAYDREIGFLKEKIQLLNELLEQYRKQGA